MKGFFKTGLTLLMIALVIACVGGMIYQGNFPNTAQAATANPSPASSGYQIITIGPISATTTSVTGIWEIKAPWPFRVIGFAGHSGAMSNTVTFDLVNSSGVSLLSSALTPSTTAGIVTEATLTTSSSTLNITDETFLRIDTATGGTGTTTNTTLQLEIKRL
jgi:hypothetical protein